jgi:hypothetical protein
MSFSITLEFTPEEIKHLYHARCSNFTKEQPDRFIIMKPSLYTFDDFKSNATLYFCSSFLEAKFLCAYLKTKGPYMILCDKCYQSMNDIWVVLSSVEFEWYNLQMTNMNNKNNM